MAYRVLLIVDLLGIWVTQTTGKSLTSYINPPVDLYLIFLKIEFEKSSWMNLIFGLFQTLILQARYTGSKNHVQNR